MRENEGARDKSVSLCGPCVARKKGHDLYSNEQHLCCFHF